MWRAMFTNRGAWARRSGSESGFRKSMTRLTSPVKTASKRGSATRELGGQHVLARAALAAVAAPPFARAGGWADAVVADPGVVALPADGGCQFAGGLQARVQRLDLLEVVGELALEELLCLEVEAREAAGGEGGEVERAV